MPTFMYEAMDSKGKTIRAELEAISKEDAVAKIKKQGYFPTQVRERAGGGARQGGAPAAGGAKAAGPKRSGGGSFGFGGVSNRQRTTFTRQLSVLQDAGLPVLRSLRILEAQQRAGTLKSTLNAIATDVEGGSTLSEAMAKHPRVFNRLYTNMIAAGEAGGVLETILQRLAEFMEKAARLKAKIQGALIYPSVVIGFACLIVIGIMLIVVPKFKEIFNDFGTSLPVPTLMLMGLSDFFAGTGYPFPGFGAALVLFSPLIVFIALKLIRKSQGGREVLDRMMLNAPVFGKIVQKSAVARFSRTLGTLLGAGVPILEAIKITRDTCGNEVFSSALNKAHDAIREGESFAAPLRQSRVVDSIVVNMIDVGEETGEIDKMLMKVADTYDEEVETAVAGLVSTLEPIMVVVLGTIVGGIVIALFMPLVTLIQSVSQ